MANNIIKVRLTENDNFEVTDLDTGSLKIFSASVLHDPQFIVDISVKTFFCEAFPGKTEWDISSDALDRIRGICDFNCISDEIRW